MDIFIPPIWDICFVIFLACISNRLESVLRLNSHVFIYFCSSILLHFQQSPVPVVKSTRLERAHASRPVGSRTLDPAHAPLMTGASAQRGWWRTGTGVWIPTSAGATSSTGKRTSTWRWDVWPLKYSIFSFVKKMLSAISMIIMRTMMHWQVFVPRKKKKKTTLNLLPMEHTRAKPNIKNIFVKFLQTLHTI